MLKVCHQTVQRMYRTNQRAATIIRHLQANQRSSYIRVMSTTADTDEALMEKIGSKAIITLNKPKALNALNLNMIRTIYPQLRAWEEEDTSMVIIKGAGDKAFCAGGDIKAVTDAGKVGGDLAKDFFKEEYILNNAIGTLYVPWIALLNGITMGGGVGLSVHGMFRVATEKTLFAMPETAIGLFPDVGGGYFLPRLGGKLGIYLALTGFRLKGRHVKKAGIATHFIESDKLDSLEKELLSLNGPHPQDINKVLDKYQDNSPRDKDTEFVLQSNMDQINNLFDGDTLEEIMEKLEKDGSEWATKHLETLRKMSPTSMKVTLRQLQLGASLSLQEVLVMEYRISQRCMEDHDFYEGVRSVLVERDNAPKWQPDTPQGVTDDKVDWYFSPLPPDRELHL